MSNTTPKIELLIRLRLLARSSAECVKMWSQRFELASQMILSSFPSGLIAIDTKRPLYE